MTVRIKTVGEWQHARADVGFTDHEVGFVPTMGALHRGHVSLVERSLVENDTTIVSIFVNPAQFNDARDLETYPRTLEADASELERLGVDFLFLPSSDTMYPDGYRYRLTEGKTSTILCGQHRPGHFDGVLTVVMRLFNIIRPDRAYFGEKDYQQLQLVTEMVDAFFLGIEIRPCPIVRDLDGVALSSRNALLNPDARKRAAEFAKILRTGTTADAVRRDLANEGITVDYVEEHWGRRLAAVVVDGVRLIDNVKLEADPSSSV